MEDGEALRVLKELIGNVLDDLKCGICMEVMQHPTALVVCTHMFCRHCILTWFERSPRCPLCKKSATKRALRALDKPNLQLMGETLLHALDDVRAVCPDAPALASPAQIYRQQQQRLTELAKQQRLVVQASPTPTATAHEQQQLEQRRRSHPNRRALAVIDANAPPSGHAPASADGATTRKRKTPCEMSAQVNATAGIPSQNRGGVATPVARADVEDGPELMCAFCHGSSKDEHGFYNCSEEGWLKVGTSGRSKTFVHTQCAIWSPEVYESASDRFVGVSKSLKRARPILCNICHRGGASLGCYASQCNKSFHLRCARATSNGRKRPSLFANNFSCFCAEHTPSEIPPDWVEDEEELGEQDDVIDLHDSCCYMCNEGGRLLCCNGCSHVVHLGCVQPPLPATPRGDWYCSDCMQLDSQLRSDEKDQDTRIRESDVVVEPYAKKCAILTTALETWQHDMLQNCLKRRRGRSTLQQRSYTAFNKFDPTKVTHLLHGKASEEEEEGEEQQGATAAAKAGAASAPFRSFKLMQALAARIPVISFQWVLHSFEKGAMLDPEPYEIKLSTRVRRKYPHGVFTGVRVDASAYSQPKPAKENLCELIRLAGGTLHNYSRRAPGAADAAASSADDCGAVTELVNNADIVARGLRGKEALGAAVSAAWVLDRIVFGFMAPDIHPSAVSGTKARPAPSPASSHVDSSVLIKPPKPSRCRYENQGVGNSCDIDPSHRVCSKCRSCGMASQLFTQRTGLALTTMEQREREREQGH
ncbi:Chromodomain-helicase-DNA-binding protein 4 [Porphyridium purpureum]|uniref:Chromodomain-helicase-DNA-binding protein 4 n=1 Tax=Porphyridium purpureum TaxID=35688 RepID=A0A5J4YQK9_PORPP|nr:Chromodomain-helicase-DNA-binding protein 4 [Porphyridium purpureum]|eukprot:POR2982..scf236_6